LVFGQRMFVEVFSSNSTAFNIPDNFPCKDIDFCSIKSYLVSFDVRAILSLDDKTVVSNFDFVSTSNSITDIFLIALSFLSLITNDISLSVVKLISSSDLIILFFFGSCSKLNSFWTLKLEFLALCVTAINLSIRLSFRIKYWWYTNDRRVKYWLDLFVCKSCEVLLLDAQVE